jgi:hypothetical protein
MSKIPACGRQEISNECQMKKLRFWNNLTFGLSLTFACLPQAGILAFFLLTM